MISEGKASAPSSISQLESGSEYLSKSLSKQPSRSRVEVPKINGQASGLLPLLLSP